MSPLEAQLTTDSMTGSTQTAPHSGLEEGTAGPSEAAHVETNESNDSDVQPTDFDEGATVDTSRWWQSVRTSVQKKFAKSDQGTSNTSGTSLTAKQVKMDMTEYHTLQPGQLSITVVVKDENDKDEDAFTWLQTTLGLTSVDAKLTSQPNKDNETQNAPETNASDEENNCSSVVVIDTVEESSPLASILEPLLEQKAQSALGEIIVSTVNGTSCSNANDLSTAIKLHAEPGKSLTLKCLIDGGHEKLVQAVVIKPTPETQLGIGLVYSKFGGQMLLTADEIVPSSCLEYSALEKGDLILAINGQPCHDMAPKGAAYFLRSVEHCVSILALKPGPSRTQRWLRQAKRAGVAVGGGAMVGVGLVFIPTLPPPFGEVLIAGGVSFLATEFEGPRRVVRSCRDSLERMVGREEEEKEGNLGADESSSLSQKGEILETISTGSTDDTEDATGDQQLNDEQQQIAENSAGDQVPPRKTMKDRLKNFSRRHVLPFLDQVVGDNPGEERTDSQEETKSPAETQAARASDENDRMTDGVQELKTE